VFHGSNHVQVHEQLRIVLEALQTHVHMPFLLTLGLQQIVFPFFLVGMKLSLQ